MRLNRQLWDHDDIVHEAKNEWEIRDFFKSVYDDGI